MNASANMPNIWMELLTDLVGQVITLEMPIDRRCSGSYYITHRDDSESPYSSLDSICHF